MKELVTLAEFDAMSPSERFSKRPTLSESDQKILDARYEEMRKTQKEQERVGAIQSRLDEIEASKSSMPSVLWKGFDPARHPRPKSHSEVMKWEKGAQGLMVSGKTGCGKSRSMAALCGRLFEESIEVYEDRHSGWRISYPVKVEWHSCAVLGDTISALAFESMTELDKLLTKLETVSILVLDDLGCQKATERVCNSFHRIIDSRYSSGLPIIASTNAAPSELQAILMDTHGRTIRRLRETTRNIDFDAEGV